jgi:Helitron helicase-like domain at N-terminus
MVRVGVNNHMLRCHQLFHQVLVDIYSKIESERILFVHLNQKKRRVNEYIHLKDAIANDGSVSDTCMNIHKML